MGNIDKLVECVYNRNMSEERRFVFWNPYTKAVHDEIQLVNRTEEERSQFMKIDEAIWDDVLDKINNHAKALAVDPETQLPIAVDPPEPTEADKADLRIMELKTYLNTTDWKVIKASELGVPLSELYPDDSVKRSEARAEINELEKLLT